MNFNLSETGTGTVRAMLFNWRARPLPAAEIVLMSDVGYREEDLTDVHDMIRQYIARSTTIVLAVPARRISAKFIEPLQEFVISRALVHALETEVLLLVLGVTDSFLRAPKKNS
jgi:hypothetical protein